MKGVVLGLLLVGLLEAAPTGDECEFSSLTGTGALILYKLRQRCSSVGLPDFEVEGMVGKGVRLGDLSTVGVYSGGVEIYHSGDGPQDPDLPEDTLSYKVIYVYKLPTMFLEIDELTYKGETGRVNVTIAENSFSLVQAIMVSKETGIVVMINPFITELSQVTTSSDNPNLDKQDWSSFFESHISEYYNNQLKEDPIIINLKPKQLTDLLTEAVQEGLNEGLAGI